MYLGRLPSCYQCAGGSKEGSGHGKVGGVRWGGGWVIKHGTLLQDFLQETAVRKTTKFE